MPAFAELEDEVVGLRPPHLVRADHDRLAVLDEGLVAVEPVGPGAGEAREAERVGAVELLALQHHLLDRPAEPPRLVVGVEVVRGDEDPEALLLRGPEESLEVLDGVVLLDAGADQPPGDALLAQHVVLRVDDDQRGVVLVDVHRMLLVIVSWSCGASPAGVRPRLPGRRPATWSCSIIGAICRCEKRWWMCCGQFTSHASTANRMARSTSAGVRRVAELRLQGRVPLDHAGGAPHLHPPAVGVVHQEEERPGVLGQVAQGDVLPVAAEVGEPERPLVDHLEEARRAAAVLDVGLARRRSRCRGRTCPGRRGTRPGPG